MSTLAAGYCPTSQEVQDKGNYFVTRMGTLASNTSADAAIKLLEEQEAYYDNLLPNCIQYFKTNSAPDCKRLNTLSASYLMLNASKKAAAKPQINQLLNNLSKTCPNQVRTFQYVNDDI